MIFEVPTHMYPGSKTDAAKELKKTSNASGIQLYLNKEINLMNKALGAAEKDNKFTGLLYSIKKNISTGPCKTFGTSSSSGFASALSEKMYASGPFKLSL